jgi:hypothetical protein
MIPAGERASVPAPTTTAYHPCRLVSWPRPKSRVTAIALTSARRQAALHDQASSAQLIKNRQRGIHQQPHRHKSNSKGCSRARHSLPARLPLAEVLGGAGAPSYLGALPRTPPGAAVRIHRSCCHCLCHCHVQTRLTVGALARIVPFYCPRPSYPDLRRPSQAHAPQPR